MQGRPVENLVFAPPLIAARRIRTRCRSDSRSGGCAMLAKSAVLCRQPPLHFLLCSLFTRNVSCLYCKFIFLLNRLQIFRYLLHSFCQKKIVFKKQLFPLSLNYGRIDCPFPCLRAERSGHSITEFVVALYKKTTDRFTFPVNQMMKENRAELHGYCRISAVLRA